MFLMKAIFLRIYKILTFLLISITSFAQLEQTKRLEFEFSNNSEEEYQVIPLSEKGLVVSYSKMEYSKRNYIINYQKYDTTFNKIWETSFRPEEQFEFVKAYHNDGFLFALFKKVGESKIGVLRIDFDSGDKIYNEGDMLTNMDVEQFVVLRSKAIITGTYNDRPVAVLFSFFDKTSKVLPELHANFFDINEIDVNEQTENIYIMLKNQRHCEYILKTYNYDGKLIKATQIGDRQQTPVSGKILTLNDKEAILTGSYADGCSQLSKGIYIQHLDQKEPQFIKFEDLNNFFKFMSPKREEKMKQRIKNRKQQGKELKLRYRLNLHDIEQTPDGWILIAEVFYPEYKSPSSTAFSTLRAYRVGNEVYNNFRFTHTVICSFDKSGKLIWDNSVSLDELESSELSEKVQISMVDNTFLLAYPDENMIKTAVMKQGENVKVLERFDLKPSNDAESISDTKTSNLSAWYGHSFIAYGDQTVRKSGAVGSKEVFYINKLTYTVKENNLKEN